MMLVELRKGITSNPELGFEHGNSGWKYLDEKKVMDILRRGFNMIKEKRIFDAPSLKRVLRGQVYYKLVSKKETTLALLGLTKESSDYFHP
jgi:hypothetical protein